MVRCKETDYLGLKIDFSDELPFEGDEIEGIEASDRRGIDH
jgi:hypothetical protein